MPAPNAMQDVKPVPLQIVGGTKFGRYPKISQEATYNMIVSDNFLVDYAGYKAVLNLGATTKGRGIYSTSVGGLILAVIGSQVFKITRGAPLNYQVVGNLVTTRGDVFLAENNAGQIGITDGVNIYIYSYRFDSFQIATTVYASLTPLPFRPGYISFQNGRFIVAALGTSAWVLSGFNDGLSWPDDAQHVGSLQTKPDTVQAALPMPGAGNVLFVFGSNVAEQWTDLGLALFPYQRSSNFNIDYGCLNPATIAELGNRMVWLGGNDQSGVVIMVNENGKIREISTDGIDFELSNLKDPANSFGFLFKQDGHLLYQFTFPDNNISYLHDFDSGNFFNVSDEEMNYHIAKKVVLFDNNFYFVSINDGNLYQMGTEFTNYDYLDDRGIYAIPRVRICPPLRLPDQRNYIGRNLGFTIENGRKNDAVVSAHVDLSISRDGGESFGNRVRRDMNPTGKRKSRFIYQRLGQVNDMTPRLEFVGFGRFTVTDGEVEVYK